jgi:hypothetical protein
MVSLDPMEMFEVQNQEMGISPLEDPLSLQLSLFERQMEPPGTIEPVFPEMIESVLEPVPQVERVGLITPAGPKSESPPVAEETWSDFYQPPVSGFGRIRASRAGARNPSDVFCELRGERIESSECNNTCEHYDQEIQVCRYGDSQRSSEEESSG